MRTLVTGGAGFIGSRVVRLLRDAGEEVRVYDALVEQVHRPGASLRDTAGVEFVRGDVRDPEALDAALRGVEQVVHLAAEVGVGQSMYEISRYVDVNSGGTACLLDVIVNRGHDLRKIVVASSMSVYGEGAYTCTEHREVVPLSRRSDRLKERRWEPACPVCDRELRPRPTPEIAPLRPGSVYAVSKLDQELLALSVGGAYGIGVTALRYFNAYGAGQSLSNPYTGVAAIFSARVLNGQPPLVYEDGEQLRDFVHVEDVARATVLALGAPRADGRSINIGTGEPISVLGVARAVAGALGREDLEPQVLHRSRAGDIRHCWADTTLARQLLGFESTHHFAEAGVQELAEWVAGQAVHDGGDAANRELRQHGLLA